MSGRLHWAIVRHWLGVRLPQLSRIAHVEQRCTRHLKIIRLLQERNNMRRREASCISGDGAARCATVIHSFLNDLFPCARYRISMFLLGHVLKTKPIYR